MWLEKCHCIMSILICKLFSKLYLTCLKSRYLFNVILPDKIILFSKRYKKYLWKGLRHSKRFLEKKEIIGFHANQMEEKCGKIENYVKIAHKAVVLIFLSVWSITCIYYKIELFSSELLFCDKWKLRSNESDYCYLFAWMAEKAQ